MNPIREWRYKHQLTQVQMAAKTGINQRTISSYEAGARPSREILKQLLDLGISVEALVLWSPEDDGDQSSSK